MDQQQQARWRRIGKQVLWIVAVIVAVTAVVFVINHFFVHRPLWDWLKLLIVPAVLAGGGLWFNAQQRDREQQIAAQRAQDDALQAYLDQMSDMLIPSKDQPSLSDESPPERLRSLARARTLTVLPRLDGNRKGRVVQFLYESGLIAKNPLVLDLRGADLSKAYLRIANLSEANLCHANLSGADLGGADLRSADLSMANLSKTNLFNAELGDTDLRGTDLNGADLRGANLSDADLPWANLYNADLTGTLLDGADLDSVEKVTNDKLAEQASTLEGATMPDGQKYED